MIYVIIPVYNAENTLKRCLDSVSGQTYRDFTTIAVDDGSKDNSLSMLKDYSSSDKRFTYISQTNKGVSGARNTALSLIGTLESNDNDYVTFIDSDDWVEPETLETLYSLAMKYSSDFTQCSYKKDIVGKGTYIPQPTFKSETFIEKNNFGNTIYKIMMKDIQINHVIHALYSVRSIKGLFMREDLKTAEDLCFNVEMFTRAQSCAFTHKMLYHYVERSDSLTGCGVSVREKFHCNRIAADSIASHLKVWGIDSPVWRLRVWMRPYRMICNKIIRKLMHKSQ